MKTCVLTLAGFLLVASLSAATTAPTIEALHAPYVRNMESIRTAAGSRAAPITKSYLAALDDLQKDATTRNDLDEALRIKNEHDRVVGGKELPPAERKTMSSRLLALRVRYEREIEPIVTDAKRAQEKVTRDYLAQLEVTQQKFTSQNQLEQAAAVRKEREMVAASIAVVLPPEPGAAGAGNSATSNPSHVGQLDPALAGKIAGVVQAKTFTLTEMSAEKETTGSKEAPAEGAVLVGFEFMETKSANLPDVRSLRPYYLNAQGVQPGKDRGEMEKITNKVMAHAGYAVGGILIHHNESRIQGIQVIFMKIIPATGKLDTTPNSIYKSPWFGSHPRGGKPMQLAGDGRLVIGVMGKTGADCDTLGLLQMPN